MNEKCTNGRHIFPLVDATIDQPVREIQLTQPGKPDFLADGPSRLLTKEPIMCQCVADEMAVFKMQYVVPTSADLRMLNGLSYSGSSMGMRILANQQAEIDAKKSAFAKAYFEAPPTEGQELVVNSFEAAVEAENRPDSEKKKIIFGRSCGKSTTTTKAELATVIDETAPVTKEQMDAVLEWKKGLDASVAGPLFSERVGITGDGKSMAAKYLGVPCVPYSAEIGGIGGSKPIIDDWVNSKPHGHLGCSVCHAKWSAEAPGVGHICPGVPVWGWNGHSVGASEIPVVPFHEQPEPMRSIAASLRKFQMSDIKPDPEIARLMTETNAKFMEKVHHTRDLINIAAKKSGVEILRNPFAFRIEPVFKDNATDGLIISELVVEPSHSNDPVRASKLLVDALQRIGFEITERMFDESIIKGGRETLRFRIKAAPDFTEKYAKWIADYVADGLRESMKSYIGAPPPAMLDENAKSGDNTPLTNPFKAGRNLFEVLDEMTSGSPTLIAKSTEVDPDRDKSLTNIRQPWSGPDESKTLHQNATDFFTHDARNKK